MPAAGRQGDRSHAPADAHGCKACAHSVTGPATGGSPDVIINHKPALRIGDVGVHAACCGPNTWVAQAGASHVLINGRPAHRLGDATMHCGGQGSLIEGSPDVIIGDSPFVAPVTQQSCSSQGEPEPGGQAATEEASASSNTCRAEAVQAQQLALPTQQPDLPTEQPALPTQRLGIPPTLTASLVPRGIWARVNSALSSLKTGLESAVVGVVKDLGKVASTLFSGIVKILRGDLEGGLIDIGMSFVRVFQTAVDVVLMVAGRIISAVQTLLWLEPIGRPLRPDEIEFLRKVYHNSVDYSRVVIKEGFAGVFSIPSRAFVHGDIIYIPSKYLPPDKALLVHEVAHVWQHQHGGTRYMSEALWAQNFGDGYELEDALEAGKYWEQLNPEQQASLLELAWAQGYFDGSGKKFEYKGIDYTSVLEDALRKVRRGMGAP